MIIPPEAVKSEMVDIVDRCISTGIRTLVSSTELLEIIEASGKYPKAKDWLSGRSDMSKLQFLAVALKSIGIEVYNARNRHRTVWKLTGGENE